jgi:hypothetical protein
MTDGRVAGFAPSELERGGDETRGDGWSLALETLAGVGTRLDFSVRVSEDFSGDLVVSVHVSPWNSSGSDSAIVGSASNGSALSEEEGLALVTSTEGSE